MRRYIHQNALWPRFEWSHERLATQLAAVRYAQGRLIGAMQRLGLGLRERAVLDVLTEDVVTSSQIEGENLDVAQVRSSIARRLGVDIGALKPADRHVDGVVEMMLDATRHFAAPLAEERLFGWHAALFPTGRSGMGRIRVGAWRDDASGPLQVVSGAIGRERVHYEAPAATRLDAEIEQFLVWFNGSESIDLVLKAGIAHLWFVTLHPFDDGNGRIARAIADMLLARSEGSHERFYSMSAQIRAERNAYYDILERTQKGTLDITPWLDWFLACLGRAIHAAEQTLEAVLDKAAFWRRATDPPMNERQRNVVNRLLDGFEGDMTSSKYAKLAHCSHDTALRDLRALMEWGILVHNAAGGRSTSYSLKSAAQV